MNEVPGPGASETTLALRKTLASDIESVLAIERHPDNSPFIGQWSEEQHIQVIAGTHGEHWVIVRVDDDSPIGYLIVFDLTPDGFGAWIQRVAVTSKSRGIGRAVLSAYLARAMSRLGANTATLDVMPTNERARRVYRAIGFVEADLPHVERKRLADRVGGLDGDGIIMRLTESSLQICGGYEVRIVE